jgi:hypothetical protein
MSASAQDTFRSILQSLNEVTNSLCVCLQNNEVHAIDALLDQRAKLLDQQELLLEKTKEFLQTADNSSREICDLKSLVGDLHEQDKSFVSLFMLKKEESAEKLKQAQNQKRLLAYSR